MAEPSFTIGIEEEYLLVDRASRELAPDPPPEMMRECQDSLQEQVTPEFLRSQIEVGTRVCTTLGEARGDLARLRGTVAMVAGRHGLAPMAASTHPFAAWDLQKTTPKHRYDVLARDLQGVVRRLLICGMHVHVGVEDEALRIDLMNQAAYFVPHLLALSTSSPFWRGHDTGLMSYRISVFKELPRTGLPTYFESWSEYHRHVDILVAAGLIEDATKIWWDLRPSARFPTLELRICDVCPRLDDAIAIAALFRCLLRMLWRLRCRNQRWRLYSPMLVDENRWRAQRYGIDEGLVDFGRGEVVSYPELLEELLDLLAEDARHFGCENELAHAHSILERGTGAHLQRRTFAETKAAGADDAAAMRAVVDALVAETVRDL